MFPRPFLLYRRRHLRSENCLFFKDYHFHQFSYLFIVKQSVGLRDWYSQISKALNPVLVQNPEVNPIVKKQLSNIMSLDPEERGASDVEQIYQVKFENIQRTDQKKTVPLQA